jgi:hypothetical protein
MMMDLHSEHMKMSTMEPLLELPAMAGKMAGEMAGKMAGVDTYLAIVLVHRFDLMIVLHSCNRG